jgi:four helix bundle protein
VAGARHFTELDCWRLSNELKKSLYDLAGKPCVRRDLRFRNQLVEAAASAPSNIAEGFAKGTHREFARYLDIALGSLNECENHVRDAVDRGYLSLEDSSPLLEWAKRARGATLALRRYLRNSPDPPD